MTLRKRFEFLPDGKKLLASAKLRRQIVKALNSALEVSEMSQSDLARELGRSRSAVNQVLTGDGNLKIETVAEYLFSMGAELEIAVTYPNSTTYSLPVNWDDYTETLKKVYSTTHKDLEVPSEPMVFEKSEQYEDLTYATNVQRVGIAA